MGLQVIHESKLFDISKPLHRADVLLFVSAMYRAFLAMGKCWHANPLKPSDAENIWIPRDNGSRIMYAITKTSRR